MIETEKLEAILSAVENFSEMLQNQKSSRVEIYTIDAACKLLGISSRTMQDLKNKGKIRYSQDKPGGKITFLYSYLVEYVENHSKEPSALIKAMRKKRG